MCGGELEITEETSVCECEYCGSKQTIPTVDDEKIMKLYDRANRLRMANEFDKAAGVYESIIAENDTEAEAYWGLLLCKYGIEYVDDPATGDKIPTCHRVSFDSIMEDSDFEMVMENADALSRTLYREQAKQIEGIRRGIIEVSEKEEPYDIFICYKETDENGDRTIDSVMAQNVYEVLTDKGYRVFFSRITLEDKLGIEYEPYIFAAINSAKVMLAFGTSYDYYNAVWVKNEWSRYIKLMSKNKEKHLIPCYKDIDAYDIPKEFKHLQAQDMGKVGAEQDLLRGIEKILNPNGNATQTNGQDIQAAVASAMVANIGSNVNALLERGFMTLEDGDFAKADSLFEGVLNQDPKCAEAYMGKLMVYYKVGNIKVFAKKIFDKIFEKKEKITLKPECSFTTLAKRQYVMSHDIKERFWERIEKQLKIDIFTNYSILKTFQDNRDYIEYFCTLDNGTEDKNGLDDKYYERYLQYATEEHKSRFDILGALKVLVEEGIEEESRLIDEKKMLLSEEGLSGIIAEANDKVKTIMGYDEIESEFQEKLKKWQKNEIKKMKDWEKECNYIKENWSTIRAEVQERWKKECERIQTEYQVEYALYQAEKAEVDEYNQRIESQFQQEKQAYENERSSLQTEISRKRMELTNLTGLFKGKQREELNSSINILEMRLGSLKLPVLSAPMKPLPVEPNPIVLPEQPMDSYEPILPNRPAEEKLPTRRRSSVKVDAEKTLLNELRNKKIKISLLEVGDVIHFGSIGGKAIEWIVVDEKEDEKLIHAKENLEGRRYHGKCIDITWETCTLRKYLNGEFKRKTFNDNEQRMIIKTHIVNKDNEEYGTSGGNDTDDYIFLLSLDEVKLYYKNVCKERSYGWWLRSPGYNNDHAAYATEFIKERGCSVDDSLGVRPALWIREE